MPRAFTGIELATHRQLEPACYEAQVDCIVIATGASRAAPSFTRLFVPERKALKAQQSRIVVGELAYQGEPVECRALGAQRNIQIRRNPGFPSGVDAVPQQSQRRFNDRIHVVNRLAMDIN